jgi:chondroitin AC lyase
MRGAVPPTTNALSGNRFFHRVDLMCHQRVDWIAAVRMSSTRVVGTESGNNENSLGHHLGDGVLEVMLTGEEYRGIPPLWNWRQLPGTTVAQTTSPLPEHPWGKNAKGKTDFVGGVSDGARGLAVMDFNRDGVTVKKSWFFLDDQIIALGAGLSSSAEATTLTTINQCFRRGDVFVSMNNAPANKAPDGLTKLVGPAWVWHDHVGYLIPAGAVATLMLEQRRSSWNAVNGNESKDPVVGDLFSLALDHGTKPENQAFEYRIVPAISREKLADFGSKAVVTNQTTMQSIAIPSEQFATVTFWSAGQFIAREVSVAVDQPCVVLLNGNKISVSNPEAKAIVVNVLVNRDGEESRARVSLPGGAVGGSTFTLPLLPSIALVADRVESEENRIDASAVSSFEAPGLRLTSAVPASLRFIHTVRSPGWWENLLSFGNAQPTFDWQITNIGAESVSLTINDKPQTLAPEGTLSIEKH